MAKTIMIQGTMSNAGKSLLAAGLCRILKQDGYRAAPFKSQNMALNSFITDSGLEMGRAQVLQAQACGIEPDVRMNPILLKPTNDIGSQVIVNGEVIGNMSAREYFSMKRDLIPDIMKAFNSLAEEYDVIVIEGAGSPAEINLKKDDIVNMGMAKLADAPVLLVGDIDRGGVFAQLVGTVQLLDEEERARVKGLIINKFRGDKTILDPGCEMLEEMTGIPVVGVVPYERIDVEDEDSLSERLESSGVIRAGAKVPGAVNIVVVRLPRMSNYTDFLMLENHRMVNITYTEDPLTLERADMIIIPGTKNTMGDLKWLRESGMEAMIEKAAAKDVPIFGICGGYQMLGELISDPCGAEEGGSMRGIGLLPVTTVFAGHKHRARVSGSFGRVHGIFSILSGKKIEGYEIHMGESTSDNSLTRVTDQMSGAVKSEGAEYKNVYGTYVHGVFDDPEVVDSIVAAIKGEDAVGSGALQPESIEEHRSRELDRLADILRGSMDMKVIYDIIGLYNN